MEWVRVVSSVSEAGRVDERWRRGRRETIVEGENGGRRHKGKG